MLPDDFTKITNLLEEPAFLIAANGAIYAANSVARQRFSRGTDNLAGRQVGDLVVDKEEKVKKYLSSCSGSTQSVVGGLRFKAADGGAHDYRCYGALVEKASGKAPAQIFLRCFPRVESVDRFVLLNRKIEELNNEVREHVAAREALRENKAVLDRVINNAAAVIYLKDLDGRYLLANEHFAGLFGLQAEAMNGKTDFDLFPAEIAGKLVCNDQLVRVQAKPQQWEETLPLASGEHVYISAKFPLLDKDNKVYATGGVSTDITEIKNAEARIKQLNDELEQRIQRRTRQLELSNKELETSNKELESYSYTIAHDLRAPIRTIVSFGQLIHEAVREKLDDDDVEDFERILFAGKRMGNLVDDMLNLSRISRREISIAEFSLSELADEVVKELSEAYPERNAKWKIRPQITVSGDRSLLGIVLTNLLGNAFKYSSTRDDSIVEFDADNNNGEVVYYVRDNGVGFDMNYSGKLFDPFQRLHGAEFEGTGIGLATVQRIIERHHGRIWAESEPEKGATFYFTLPLEVSSD